MSENFVRSNKGTNLAYYSIPFSINLQLWLKW